MKNAETIRTGISGLDRIFLGGIPEGNLILVEGGAGAGKTLMGVEFIYRGATASTSRASSSSSRRARRSSCGRPSFRLEPRRVGGAKEAQDHLHQS